MINGVILRYKEIQRQVESGSRGWYRTRQQIVDQKKQKGGLSAATWHLREGITQTLYLPITPNSELVGYMKKQLADFVGPDGGKTAVSEQGGSQLSVSCQMILSDSPNVDGMKSVR